MIGYLGGFCIRLGAQKASAVHAVVLIYHNCPDYLLISKGCLCGFHGNMREFYCDISIFDSRT